MKSFKTTTTGGVERALTSCSKLPSRQKYNRHNFQTLPAWDLINVTPR